MFYVLNWKETFHINILHLLHSPPEDIRVVNEITLVSQPVIAISTILQGLLLEGSCIVPVNGIHGLNISSKFLHPDILIEKLVQAYEITYWSEKYTF